MKVLVIEDDPMLRRIVIRTLRHLYTDVDVKVAESVDEAIDHLREAVLDKPFDLVTSDYNLLGSRTGADVLEWIREHASFLIPHFLFLSGNDEIWKLHDNCLAKPAGAAELRAAIQATVQRS
jgi:DNA-binding response OmpR family regulator